MDRSFLQIRASGHERANVFGKLFSREPACWQPFQANSAARLAEIFAQQRRDNVDLGFFPSVPTQVNFELLYAPAGGRWRLFGLSVSFGRAAPAAPQPPAPAAPLVQPKQKAPAAQVPAPAPKSTVQPNTVMLA